MFTSLLYDAFGVRGYRHVRTEFDGDMVSFHVEAGADRREADLDRGRDSRVECHTCGLVRQIDLGFAPPRKQYTKAFGRYLLDLARHMTIQDVANHLCIRWDTAKDLKKEYLERHLSRPCLKRVRQITIDHFHVVKLLNEKLTALRRELYTQATDQLHKQVLKGTSWLLLKPPPHTCATNERSAAA